MDQERIDRYVKELRETADFLVRHGDKLPEDTWMSTDTWINLTKTEYVDSEDGGYETVIDEKGTKKNLKKFLDAVGDCEKDYNDDRIIVTKRFESTGNTMFRGEIDRSVACKRKVVGTKVIPATPARVVDEVEWDCDENISLLKLTKGL